MVLRVEVEGARPLRFDDGAPVRAASAVARLGDGWLVAQDDANHAAWVRRGSIKPVRMLPAVEGLDLFSAAEGTKLLKPDLEAACEVAVGREPGVLLLGSGSSPARMRAVLVRLESDGAPSVVSADLTAVYQQVAAVLGIAELNLEGACRVGDRLRWFHRGNPRAGTPSASVDVDLGALLAAVTGSACVVAVGAPRIYELGEVGGVGLAVTDAVTLPDGRLLLSAAAEDTPNPIDDGEVVGSALVVVDDDVTTAVAPLPVADGGSPWKVEGLALDAADTGGVMLRAVVDADDPSAPSAELALRGRWVSPGR